MDQPQPATLGGATTEDEVLAGVRDRAEQVVSPPSGQVGALLRLMARLTGVRHAVEIGAAGGVSGAYLVAGMSAGMLTCIEGDAHLHGLATGAYDELRIAERVRAILGDPATVAERLADAGYDLVLLQHGPAAAAFLPVAERLLRDGGLLAVRHAGADADGAVSEVATAVDEGDWTDVAMLGLDDGLLLARRAPRG